MYANKVHKFDFCIQALQGDVLTNMATYRNLTCQLSLIQSETPAIAPSNIRVRKLPKFLFSLDCLIWGWQVSLKCSLIICSLCVKVVAKIYNSKRFILHLLHDSEVCTKIWQVGIHHWHVWIEFILLINKNRQLRLHAEIAYQSSLQ